MKRLLVMGLSLAMFVSLMAGCQQRSGSDVEVEDSQNVTTTGTLEIVENQQESMTVGTLEIVEPKEPVMMDGVEGADHDS